MNDLWDVIAELANVLSPERVESAAKKLQTLPDRHALPGKGVVFGPNLDGERWGRFLETWAQAPEVSPLEVAAALRAASVFG